jgi:hypothetical protein
VSDQRAVGHNLAFFWFRERIFLSVPAKEEEPYDRLERLEVHNNGANSFIVIVDRQIAHGVILPF